MSIVAGSVGLAAHAPTRPIVVEAGHLRVGRAGALFG
jgi:hypothetical protein